MGKGRYQVLDTSPTRAPGRTASWIAFGGTVAIVGIAYFLAARLSITLFTMPDGVAAFWPAAGIAAGAMIAFGSAARLPVAIAAAVATLLSSIGGELSLATTIVFAGTNAGEVLLFAWLIERHHGREFSLDTLPRVLGFFLAAGIATAVSAVGGVAGLELVEGSDASAPTTWLHLAASHALGIVAVAPLIVGIVRALQDMPDLPEVLEGTGILAVLASASVLGFGWSTDHWFTILPLAMVLPLLVWPAARCAPVFAAFAVLIVALVIVATVTLGVGRLGDASVPLSDRLVVAQSALMSIAICTLVTAALFAERRSREALLNGSNERLRTQEEAFRRLLGSLPAAIYTTDRAGRITYCNRAAVELWGSQPALGQERWSDHWRLHHPDGTSVPLGERPTQIVLNEGRAVRGREALLERPDGTLVPIMPCPAPLIDDRGAVIGVVNMQLDLTEQKRAEAALAERDALLTLASKAARVGSYCVDCSTATVRLTPGCAALYGLPEGTTELAVAASRTCLHPEDVAGVDARFAHAFREGQREVVAQFRIVRPSDGGVRWIETRALVSYEAGLPSRIVGIDIDVTERRRAEAEIKESEAHLADALAAGQVIAFEWDAATRQSRRSKNAAGILGDEENDGLHCSHSERFFERVHHDDRERFKACVRGLRPDQPSYALSFRFRSSDGRQLWLEETAKGEFDADGRLLRIKGLTRNVTERRNTQRALADRNLQLSLAGKAARVGSFSYAAETGEIQVSEGYGAIHGLPEGTSRTTLERWRAGVHPEDLPGVDDLRNRAIRERRGEYRSEYRVVRASGEVRWIETRCFISYRADGRPEQVVGVNIDVTARKRAEEHQRMLVAELDHRVKNVLATVNAVVSRTQETDASPAEFVATLAGRIRSMAETHELLSRRQWQGISVRELVRRELAPYMTGSNADLDGPELTLRPEAAQAVSMVLHELTTNAAKHGALSNDDGRVSVRWSLMANGQSHDRVRIEWQEACGPAVRTPESCGYGMEVIRGLVPYELDGTVDLVFAPEGLRCTLTFPAAAAGGGAQAIKRPDRHDEHLAAV
jgi:PAS domain S-box-containing protein